MRASESDIAKLEKLALERGGTVHHHTRPIEAAPAAGDGVKDRALSGPAARGRSHHTPGRMNKTEAVHALRLDARMQAGEVSCYWFEKVKLRLADRTWYTPDFCVIMADGSIQFHEVKGHWEDDARVKWKMAGELYPQFSFYAFTKKGVERYGRK